MDINIEDFQHDINRLFVCSTLYLLPSNVGAKNISSAESKRLIGIASILSISDDPDELSLAYEIISRLVECESDDKEKIAQAADIILSRIGNFPGRELLRRRYKSLEDFSPALALSLERLARRLRIRQMKE